MTVVGACMYTCCHGQDYNLVPTDASDLSDKICGKRNFVSNRQGQLCGRCKEVFVPPAYSYDWRCVQCTNSSLINTIK